MPLLLGLVKNLLKLLLGLGASTSADLAPSMAFWMATPMMSRYSVTPTISGNPSRPIFMLST